MHYTPNEIKTYCIKNGLEMQVGSRRIDVFRGDKFLRGFRVTGQHVDGRDFDNWLKYMELPPTGKRHL